MFNQGQGPAKIQGQQGELVTTQWAYLQSIRKEWKCRDGHCEEEVVKCKNGACDSFKNQFRADNYQPELPQLEPIAIPIPPNLSSSIASLLTQNPKNEIPPSSQFDNTGSVDLVVDTNNAQFYFSNAKFVNSKCLNGVCEIKTTTCTNGKCEESILTKKL